MPCDDDGTCHGMALASFVVNAANEPDAAFSCRGGCPDKKGRLPEMPHAMPSLIHERNQKSTF